MAWNEPGGNPAASAIPGAVATSPSRVRPTWTRSSATCSGGWRAVRRRYRRTRHRRRQRAGRGFGVGTILLALLAIWAFTGLYRVDAAERGIILRFGRHVDTTHARPALALAVADRDEADRQHRQTIDSFSEQTRMLTSDENLVDINLEVQFRRANPLDYAFNVFKPEDTLKEVSESAIREVIGRSKLDCGARVGPPGDRDAHQGADPAHARCVQDRPGGHHGQPAGRAVCRTRSRRRSRTRSRRARTATACRWRRRRTPTT